MASPHSSDTPRAPCGRPGGRAAAPERVEAAPGVTPGGTRDLAWIEREWLVPALEALRAGRLATLGLDEGDGWRWELRRRQALRVWRRPLAWPAT